MKSFNTGEILLKTVIGENYFYDLKVYCKVCKQKYTNQVAISTYFL